MDSTIGYRMSGGFTVEADRLNDCFERGAVRVRGTGEVDGVDNGPRTVHVEDRYDGVLTPAWAVAQVMSVVILVV